MTLQIISRIITEWKCTLLETRNITKKALIRFYRTERLILRPNKCLILYMQ